MRPTILVTGGAGYIGSHTCKALFDAGWLPVAYDDLSNGHDWAVRWGPLEMGDIRDRDRLIQVIRRHNPVGVLHFAGLIEAGLSVTEPMRFYDVNVRGTMALLEAIMATAPIPLVFSSTAAVYGALERSPADETHPLSPVSPYGRSKLMVEQIIADLGEAKGLNWTALRYFNAAGADPEGEVGEAHRPETHLIPLALEAAAGSRPAFTLFGTDYATPDGTCVRDFIHVADLARAHVMALSRLLGGGWSTALNLGTGQGYSVRDVIKAVEKVSGWRVPLLVRDRRPGDPPALVGDSRRAESVLGWTPVRSALEDIVTDAWNWHCRHFEGIMPLDDRPVPDGCLGEVPAMVRRNNPSVSQSGFIFADGTDGVLRDVEAPGQ